MYWAAFRDGERTEISALEGDPDSAKGGVTARVILEQLQSVLPHSLREGDVFQQDNASTHRAHIVQSWLRSWARENGVELLEWPPYSPDLNPEENLCKLMKTKTTKDHDYLQSIPDTEASLPLLDLAVDQAWQSIEH